MKKKMWQKPGGLSLLRKFLFALMGSILLSYSTAVSSDTDDTVQLLLSGTWGLEVNPNLFDMQKANPKKHHPAVVYIPPGTIVFKSEESPEWLEGYIRVQLHYGHWVHIKKIQESDSILTSIKNLIEPPPSNTVLVHRPLFCLGQTNLLLISESKCNDGKPPLGKGWTSTFKNSRKPKFLELTVTLDEKTKSQIAERGWDPALTQFVVEQKDIRSLEESGDITMLDKTYPRVEFEYKDDSEYFIKCGTTEISEEDLKEGWNIEAKASVETKLPGWLSFIGSELGIDIGKNIEQNKHETRKTEEINTTEASYLFYAATRTESGSNETSDIVVEKVFECKSSPKAEPGDKILTVKFYIETPGENDASVYAFTDPQDYLNMPDKIYEYHHRPVFLSINSVKQYERVLKKIMDEHNVDVHLAHFMLANMNTTCHGGKKRERCAKIIDDNES